MITDWRRCPREVGKMDERDFRVEIWARHAAKWCKMSSNGTFQSLRLFSTPCYQSYVVTLYVVRCVLGLNWEPIRPPDEIICMRFCKLCNLQTKSHPRWLEAASHDTYLFEVQRRRTHWGEEFKNRERGRGRGRDHSEKGREKMRDRQDIVFHLQSSVTQSMQPLCGDTLQTRHTPHTHTAHTHTTHTRLNCCTYKEPQWNGASLDTVSSSTIPTLSEAQGSSERFFFFSPNACSHTISISYWNHSKNVTFTHLSLRVRQISCLKEEKKWGLQTIDGTLHTFLSPPGAKRNC